MDDKSKLFKYSKNTLKKKSIKQLADIMVPNKQYRKKEIYKKYKIFGTHYKSKLVDLFK